MIIDEHVHVVPEQAAEATKRYFEERTGYKLEFNFSIDDLLRVMGTTIDKAFINNIPAKADIVLKANDWVAQEVRKHPDKLVGIFAPHPDMPDMAYQAERYVKEFGFKGIKINPSLQYFYPEDERLRPLFEKVSKLKVPILTHTGRNNENFFKPLDRSVRQYSEPASWLPIVTSYPEIDFVFDHFAGAQDYWDDALKLLSYPNAYTDFARMVSVLSPKTIIKFIKAVGAEKIMYGSDYPGHNALKDIEQIKALDVSEEAKRAILGDNAARAYHLD